jgi:hypothetical protein
MLSSVLRSERAVRAKSWEGKIMSRFFPSMVLPLHHFASPGARISG